MPIIAKKTSKKEPKDPASISKASLSEKYFQGIGRRKSSVARVKLFMQSAKKDRKTDQEILINGKQYDKYFSLSELRDIVKSPLKAVSCEEVSKIIVSVRGGGIRGQSESVRLGIARALILINQEFKKTLKDLGYLTRDARMVERKKPGLKKARRAPQFSKR